VASSYWVQAQREAERRRREAERGDTEAVINYCSMVLAASRYPDGFPQQHKVAFVPV
jgi:hypothetical protein